MMDSGMPAHMVKREDKREGKRETNGHASTRPPAGREGPTPGTASPERRRGARQLKLKQRACVGGAQVGDPAQEAQAGAHGLGAHELGTAEADHHLGRGEREERRACWSGPEGRGLAAALARSSDGGDSHSMGKQ